ncbi:MAG: methyltransferase domain-containing protein [Gammaproteobacteria bacterium]|nr:methyltransferase domain-containing protein [Gammaproteobacteria bacterium]
MSLTDDTNLKQTKKWNERYAARELVWSARPNQQLVDSLASLGAAPGRALDVGCGEGRNALWLAEQGWQVTAVDFSSVAIDKARQIAARRGVAVDWVVADVVDWEPPRHGFDLAIATYLQTSSAERERWLRHAVDALADAGVFIYIGHDTSNLEHGTGGPKSADVLATPGDIECGLPGFEIVQAEVVMRNFDTEPEHGGSSGRIALDTLVIARKS